MCLLLQPDTDLHDSHRRSYIFFVTPCILQQTLSLLLQPDAGLHDSHRCFCIFFVTPCILQQTSSVLFECSLTPVYMILIGVLASLFVYFGRGPFWPYVDPTDELYQPCKDHWWTNLLYVNNIVYPIHQVLHILSLSHCCRMISTYRVGQKNRTVF